ncbi:MAG: Thioredoxin, partial [uncultured Solirubrobacteraceae bacterium]
AVDHLLLVLRGQEPRGPDRRRLAAVRALPDAAALARRRRRGVVRRRDAGVGARRGGLLGGVVRPVPHDRPDAAGPRHPARRAAEGRQGGRGRQSPARRALRRAVHPAPGRPPRGSRGRPGRGCPAARRPRGAPGAAASGAL